MKKVALRTQAITAATVVLWGSFAIAQAVPELDRQDRDNRGQVQSQQLAQQGTGGLQDLSQSPASSLPNAGDPVQGNDPDKKNGSLLQGAYSNPTSGPLQAGGPFQGAGPLQNATPLLGAGPFQGAGPLLGVGPLLDGTGPLTGIGPLQGNPPLLSGAPEGITGPINISVPTSPPTGLPPVLLVSLPQQQLPLTPADSTSPAGVPNSPIPPNQPQVSNPPGGGPPLPGDPGPGPGPGGSPIPTCTFGCGPQPPPPNNVPPQNNGTPS